MKRLTPAAVTLIMVVVVSLLATAYFAKILRAEEPQASPVPQVEFREVPISLNVLEPGTEVTAACLGTGRVRVDDLRPETLLAERALVGRIVKEAIPTGAPIRSSQLYPPGERPPLVVGPGMRAVSLTFSQDASLVGGLLRPGQTVDVHLTPTLDGPQAARFRGGLTLTLLRGVRVLAITGSGAASDSTRSVTLELTPERANVVILAREKGTIALSYNPEGTGTGGVAVKNQDRATLNEILGVADETPRASASPPPFVSETYRGNALSLRQFPADREP